MEEEMKVGPKGQVVIPRAMRKFLKIQPGSRVIFRLEGNRVLIQKPEFDAVAVLEDISKKGKSVKSVPPHLYEEELSKRIG
ncbi:MAG: AbrB/MazE/SpoVT family DNA-binding domain-containing protein [Candidatus Methanomethyliaceae archaeon]|nr:AbrB/MazE/SpoVT family DNA-binding domain-containing protein [Candidatus Methanomethyliaceae archaeon]